VISLVLQWLSSNATIAHWIVALLTLFAFIGAIAVALVIFAIIATRPRYDEDDSCQPLDFPHDP
jgi:hypothetical protein